MKITRILLILLIALNAGQLYAVSQQDSTVVEWRAVPDETMQSLSEDDDLNYPLEVGENAGWFQRAFELFAEMLNWLYRMLGEGLSNEFLYLLAILAGIALVWMLLRSNYSWVFTGKKKEKSLGYEEGKEDIHSINFEEEIQKAVQQSNYRIAVRLVYLHILKLLSDNKDIRWIEGKTNNEYIKELKDTSYRNDFIQLSYHFNYLWYGHFEANKQNWTETDQVYQHLLRQIRN